MNSRRIALLLLLAAVTYGGLKIYTVSVERRNPASSRDTSLDAEDQLDLPATEDEE